MALWGRGHRPGLLVAFRFRGTARMKGSSAWPKDIGKTIHNGPTHIRGNWKAGMSPFVLRRTSLCQLNI